MTTITRWARAMFAQLSPPSSRSVMSLDSTLEADAPVNARATTRIRSLDWRREMGAVGYP